MAKGSGSAGRLMSARVSVITTTVMGNIGGRSASDRRRISSAVSASAERLLRSGVSPTDAARTLIRDFGR